MSETAQVTAQARPAPYDDSTQQIRMDLTAAHRLIHRICPDKIYTHISVGPLGRHDRFLVSPYGQHANGHDKIKSNDRPDNQRSAFKRMLERSGPDFMH